MTHLRIIPLAALLFLFACSSSKQSQSAEGGKKNKHEEDYRLWKQDPLGCRGDRTEELALRIVGSFKESSPSREAIESWIGAAEDQVPDGEEITLTYYYDTDCVANALKEGEVYCVMEITYSNKGKFLRAGVVCG